MTYPATILQVGEHVRMRNKWGRMCTYLVARRLDEAASTDDWSDPPFLKPVPPTEPITARDVQAASAGKRTPSAVQHLRMRAATSDIDAMISEAIAELDQRVHALEPPEQKHDITVQGGQGLDRVIIRCSCGALADTMSTSITVADLYDYIGKLEHRNG